MLAKYLVRRLFASVVVVLGVTAITLVLMDRTRGTYVPGIDLNPNLRPDDIERLRANLGLDRPFYVWYVTWLWNVVHADFGRSMIDGSPVTSHILDRLEHLILPATVLSFFYLSIWSRFTRSSMLEVLSQDYIRTARAKGMGERRVVYLHGLRNALIPLITLVGLELPGLVSGGLVVEVVFGWPGIGRLLFERALQYDYSTVMGVTFFATLLVIAGNLLADMLYAVLDPRIRYA